MAGSSSVGNSASSTRSKRSAKLAVSNDDADDTRRAEIMQIASSVVAASGLKTSLNQIAEAAGILPSSMYHHFDSKEAIFVELMRKFHSELDLVGTLALERMREHGDTSPEESIRRLCIDIARCADDNRAALQMSFYEIPSAHKELSALTHRPPTKIYDAMLEALRAARLTKSVRADVEIPILADRLCQSMLHVGLDVIRHKAPPDQTAITLYQLVMRGLAAKPPTDAALDKSAALAAAERAISTWVGDDHVDVDDERMTHIFRVARREFGRKGYELTTTRDIASAAGLTAATFNRLIKSKEQLLGAVMHGFDQKVSAGWNAVLKSDSTAVEKLDALTWVNINVLDKFSDEFRIQLAWMRQSPPSAPTPGKSFATRIRQVKTVLVEGDHAGELRVDTRSVESLARCVVDIMWIPDTILDSVGQRSALLIARDFLLRGSAVRG